MTKNVLLTSVKSFLGTHLAVDLANHGYNVKGTMLSMDQAEILDGFLAQHLKDPDSTGMVQHEGDYEAHEDEEKKEDLDLTGEHPIEFLPQPRSTVEAWKETIQRSDAEVVIVSITVDSTAASHAHLNHQELVLTLTSETETMLQACIESDSVQKSRGSIKLARNAESRRRPHNTALDPET